MASLPYPLNWLYNHGRVGMAGMPYHSVCTIFIPFISVDSCLAKRRPFCGFQNLKPVGFCAFCAFCGNYKQRFETSALYSEPFCGNYKQRNYKIISAINPNSV